MIYIHTEVILGVIDCNKCFTCGFIPNKILLFKKKKVISEYMFSANNALNVYSMQ